MASKAESFWGDVLALGGSILLAVTVDRHIGPWLAPLILDDASVLYGALVGLHGSLLGFVLAALTVVMSVQGTSSLRLLREAGHLTTLLHVYLAAIRTFAVAVAIALIALVVSEDAAGAHVIAWAVTFVTALALARLARVLWATRGVVNAIVNPKSRAPGAR